MDAYEDLDTYNNEPIHDMEVDFDFHINTGELPEYFDDTDVEDYINNLND